jgi:hypothetical protein
MTTLIDALTTARQALAELHYLTHHYGPRRCPHTGQRPRYYTIVDPERDGFMVRQWTAGDQHMPIVADWVRRQGGDLGVITTWQGQRVREVWLPDLARRSVSALGGLITDFDCHLTGGRATIKNN